jgi:ligand-binding sensor domain-containing protein
MRLLDCLPHLGRGWSSVRLAALMLQVGCCGSLAAGAAQQYIVRSWSADDGLPHNYILAVMQAREGYLWVGTRSGLARFDGARFTPVDWGPIQGAQIGSLCESRDGSLWMALEGHGVLRWDEGGVSRYGVTNGLKSNFVRALYEARDGSMWIAARGGLAQCRRGELRTFAQTNGLAGPFVEAVCEDAGGNLWVGTSEGLNCLKDGTVIATLTTRDGLPGNSVTALCVDRKGNLWIGTSEGLAVRSAGKVQVPYHEAEGLPERFIRTLY